MNSREFCEENKLGEECLEFGEKNPRLIEFWDNCNHYDWLLKLAHPNATDLRALIKKIQNELEIHKIQYTNPYPPSVPEGELMSQAGLVAREYRRAAPYRRKDYKTVDQQLADWVREFCKLGI